MKFNKHIEYNPGKHIWRILITDDDQVVFEKRDTEDKQVYFDCINIETKKNTFEDLQLDEKFWIGIEKIYKGIIFFHKFTKPDMPGHKEIIAYDIEKDEVLWRNEEYAYLFVYDGKVYVFKELFEGRKYVALEYLSGEEIEDLGSDANKINELYDKARAEEDFTNYTFPKTLPSENEKVNARIEELKSKLAIVGEVEYNVLDDILLTGYHTKPFENSMINKFTAFNIDSGKELLNETLAPNVDSFMMDSFFVYKSFLFLLKEKSGVLIYKMSE